MLQAIRERVTIKPGGVVEIFRPELPAGAEAEVIIMIEQQGAELPPLASFIGKGKSCFANAEEVDAFVKGERDSWEC